MYADGYSLAVTDESLDRAAAAASALWRERRSADLAACAEMAVHATFCTCIDCACGGPSRMHQTVVEEVARRARYRMTEPSAARIG